MSDQKRGKGESKRYLTFNSIHILCIWCHFFSWCLWLFCRRLHFQNRYTNELCVLGHRSMTLLMIAPKANHWGFRGVAKEAIAPPLEVLEPPNFKVPAPKGWFTLVRPSGPVWAFGPGYRSAGRHGKSWASRPARRHSRPSSVRPLPLVRMACRAGNHCNLVAGMRAFWRLSFTVVLTRIWTRIKANGRSLPSATPSSPFSAIRAPSFAATYLTSAGQSRWTLASRFGNGNIDENVGEWHRNSLKWSCQCNSYSALVCSYSRNRSFFTDIPNS